MTADPHLQAHWKGGKLKLCTEYAYGYNQYGKTLATHDENKQKEDTLLLTHALLPQVRRSLPGFDEMDAAYNMSLRRIFGAIKEKFPMVKTMATLNAWVGWGEMDPSLPVDIWVETYNDGPQAQPICAQQLSRWLKAGKQYCKMSLLSAFASLDTS